MSRRCFVCDDSNPNRLQEHHIVPRAYGGSDSDVNVVDLCAGCHQAIEKMYDRRFYRELGVDLESAKRPVDEMDGIETYGVSHGVRKMAESEGHELAAALREYDVWPAAKIAEELCWLVARRGCPFDVAHRRVRRRLIEQAGVDEKEFVELSEYSQLYMEGGQ